LRVIATPRRALANSFSMGNLIYDPPSKLRRRRAGLGAFPSSPLGSAKVSRSRRQLLLSLGPGTSLFAPQPTLPEVRASRRGRVQADGRTVSIGRRGLRKLQPRQRRSC
jgi:hypothetical protein